MLTSLSFATNPRPDAALLASAVETISLPVIAADVAPCAAPLAMEAISLSSMAPATVLPTVLLTPLTAREVTIFSTSISPVVSSCIPALIAARSASPGSALTMSKDNPASTNPCSTVVCSPAPVPAVAAPAAPAASAAPAPTASATPAPAPEKSPGKSWPPAIAKDPITISLGIPNNVPASGS